jgi:hypothetical protein
VHAPAFLREVAGEADEFGPLEAGLGEFLQEGGVLVAQVAQAGER